MKSISYPKGSPRINTIPTPAAKEPVPTENQEQAILFDIALQHEIQYPELRLMFAIPNGAFKGPAARRLFQATGLKSGVPDIFLPVMRKGYGGLWIEMKRTKGGSVSPEQFQWHKDLREAGYHAAVCKGWQEAWQIITEYLESK